MMASTVKFVSCTLASFGSLEQKDPGTLYFVTDERRIYKGATPFTGGIFKTVSQYPESGDVNTIYVNTTDGSVKFWDGAAYQVIVKPQPAELGVGSSAELATTKAVVDYVASKLEDVNSAADALAKRVTAAEGEITTINGKLGVIQGDGEGSIAKAKADAIAHTDEVQKTLQANIDKKADKATTLAGYGIGDAYTKTETDKQISTAVANAGHLKRAIVDSLPAVAEADANTIYMVKKTAGELGSAADNGYDEWMLVNGKFEKVGDSAVDLTDYATKAYAEQKANDALASAKSYADEKVNALDVTDTAVADQYVSAVSEKDGKITVTRATLPIRTVAEGSANGMIAVNGTDVKVHGLGSAAYTDSDAYATAAQGKKADSALQTADVATGKTNGTIAVRGTDVKVFGLGSAAYTNTDAYDAAGAAAGALNQAKTYTDQALTWTEL